MGNTVGTWLQGYRNCSIWYMSDFAWGISKIFFPLIFIRGVPEFSMIAKDHITWRMLIRAGHSVRSMHIFDDAKHGCMTYLRREPFSKFIHIYISVFHGMLTVNVTISRQMSDGIRSSLLSVNYQFFHEKCSNLLRCFRLSIK